jgi:2-iminobutanoate/2-iminopropanoate deaminase
MNDIPSPIAERVDAGRSPLRFHNPARLPPPDGKFSQVALVDAGTRLMFVSGQVPRDQEGHTVGIGDMRAQALCVFESLRNALASEGSGFGDVIKATIFVTDRNEIEALMGVRTEYYGDAAPASTLVVVAGLGNPDWLLEVELIAVCRRA